MTIGWMTGSAARDGSRAVRSRDWAVGAVLVGLLALLAAGTVLSPPPAGTPDDGRAAGPVAERG